MVINSTNINKTITSHLKKTMTYDVGNPGPGMGPTEKCVCVRGRGRLNWLMGSQRTCLTKAF